MHSLLTNTTDLLRVVTGVAADLDCIVSFIEYTNNASPPVLDPLDVQFTNITAAATTTILGAPSGATKRRRIKAVSIVNTHATNSTTCRVIIERSGPVNWDLFNTVVLAPGESLTFTEGTGWFYNRAGASLPVDIANSSLAAQTGFAADTYVVGSSLIGLPPRVKAGTWCFWEMQLSKTAAGVAAPTFNIRYGTAGSTADTSRCLFTGPAQSAVADTATITIKALFRSVGAAAVLQGEFSMHHNLAATGFATVNPAGLVLLSTTSGSFDCTVANSIIGLSMNGGASASWTVTQVVARVENLL